MGPMGTKAGWPAWLQGNGGPSLPLLGSAVLSIRSLPPSISELPSPRWSLSAPPEEGLVLHSHGFPWAFSKGAKGAWGGGYLKVKVATDTSFPL